MKTGFPLLFACFSSVVAAEEPLPLFPATKIEMPSLSLSDGGKKGRPGFFREDGPWAPVKKPALSVEKKSTPGVIVPRDGIDPQMIIAPRSTVNFKMTIIPAGGKPFPRS